MLIGLHKFAKWRSLCCRQLCCYSGLKLNLMCTFSTLHNTLVWHMTLLWATYSWKASTQAEFPAFLMQCRCSYKCNEMPYFDAQRPRHSDHIIAIVVYNMAQRNSAKRALSLSRLSFVYGAMLMFEGTIYKQSNLCRMYNPEQYC